MVYTKNEERVYTVFYTAKWVMGTTDRIGEWFMEDQKSTAVVDILCDMLLILICCITGLLSYKFNSGGYGLMFMLSFFFLLFRRELLR